MDDADGPNAKTDMTDKAVKLSIKSLFLWVVMSITTFSLAVLSSLAVYTQIKTYRHELESNALMLAKLVARSAATYLYDETPERIEAALSNLTAAEHVLNAHVYKAQNKSLAPQIFASYNKEGQLLLGGKENQLSALFMAPQLADNGKYLELSTKVFDTETNISLGWVYLRVSSDNFNQLVGKSIWLNLAVALALLAISFYSAVRMQRIVTGPVENIANFLQRTSRQRDYSARASGSTIKELDILADAVNVMLYRMQEYMQKQREAEEQHRKLNASLEDMVSHRTTALKDANQELIQTLEKLHQFQRQIVQNEKMASLGDMVAGVAHEVNTPIGLGVTASTMMLDRLAVIQKDFENKTLKASAMKRFLDESNENLNIIYRNLNRAAELISSFKQVAVDQTSETSRSFCVVQLVNEILLSLQPRPHLVEAGADFFLMPSQFEPCGLNQMYSLAYGTIPIVRSVGGLKDTVIDYSNSDNGTGFVFDDPTPHALLSCIRRALLAFYEDAGKFREMQQRGMRTRFTWEAAAKDYQQLYASTQH